MDNIIEFYDFNDKPTGRGRKLKDNEMSVWFNKSYNAYQATIAQNISTEKTHVRIGKIGSDICLVFSDNGIKIRQNAKNVIFISKPFVELILGSLEGDKNRKVVNLKRVNSDLYIIQNN